MKTKNLKRCYYCGGMVQSREHIPPRQMFKLFKCDSITVPSCDDHNTKKSGHDQAIVNALLIPLFTGRHRYKLEPEIDLVIKDAIPSFERTKRNVIRSAWIKDPPRGLKDLPDLAFLASSVDMAKWIRQLTAGLIYDGIGSASGTIGWSKSIVWSPDWFSANTPAPIEFEEAVEMVKSNQEVRSVFDGLIWHKGWSAYPKPYPEIIYSFQMHLDQKGVFVHHKFYNRFNWYVLFKSSKRNIKKLQTKLEAP
jgi:hypothetical protein